MTEKDPKSPKSTKKAVESEKTVQYREIDPFTLEISVLVDKAAIAEALAVQMLTYLLSGEE